MRVESFPRKGREAIRPQTVNGPDLVQPDQLAARICDQRVWWGLLPNSAKLPAAIFVPEGAHPIAHIDRYAGKVLADVHFADNGLPAKR